MATVQCSDWVLYDGVALLRDMLAAICCSILSAVPGCTSQRCAIVAGLCDSSRLVVTIVMGLHDYYRLHCGLLQHQALHL